MQNQKTRQVVFFDLNLATSPPGKLPAMGDLARFLKERVDADLCVRLIEAERYLIGITRARIVKKANGAEALALLFVFVDPDAADPANMHLHTREVRRFAKQAGEGRAISAHVLVDLEPRVYGGAIFRVLLENADRLGKTRVRAELQREMREVFRDKEITVENIDGDDVAAAPKIDMSAVAGDRLRQGITQGTLKELKLIDAKAIERGFDAPEPVKVQRREMSLKVQIPPGQRLEDVLEAIKPWARANDFEEMYVRWVPAIEEGPMGPRPPQEAERAKINLAQEDIGETLYARKEFVQLAEPLSDLCDDLSNELVDAMKGLLS
ncbi:MULTISPECIES: hypothetical protein [unclassified Sphingomonas]|uniref:hypothetical protein n=1 Tax=unclassified Sphingomonas TaxID=196159 RepID=UPI00226A4C18|nr:MULTISPECIES: hypothetical protein [unclassified Sphingomonas]